MESVCFNRHFLGICTVAVLYSNLRLKFWVQWEVFGSKVQAEHFASMYRYDLWCKFKIIFHLNRLLAVWINGQYTWKNNTFIFSIQHLRFDCFPCVIILSLCCILDTSVFKSILTTKCACVYLPIFLSNYKDVLKSE